MISPNTYTQDGKVKSEIQDFFNTAIQSVGKKLITNTLNKAKIPDAFSNSEFVPYHPEHRASTFNFLEYLPYQAEQQKVAYLQKKVDGLLQNFQEEQKKTVIDLHNIVTAEQVKIKGLQDTQTEQGKTSKMNMGGLRRELENSNAKAPCSVLHQSTFIGVQAQPDIQPGLKWLSIFYHQEVKTQNNDRMPQARYFQLNPPIHSQAEMQ